MRGKFITFEGVDGAGKSTQLERAAQLLRARGKEVVVTREPGGTDLAERLRELLLTQGMSPLVETLLMFAARADHVEKVIRPALDAGKWVVCDRFTDATVAYQGAGKGVPPGTITSLADVVHPGLVPDWTFFFDCSVKVARTRLAGTGRALDRFEQEGSEFFDRVRASYRALASSDPSRFIIIDSEDSPANISKRLEDSILTICS